MSRQSRDIILGLELVEQSSRPLDELTQGVRRECDLAMPSFRLEENKPVPYFNGRSIFRKETSLDIHARTPRNAEQLGIWADGAKSVNPVTDRKPLIPFGAVRDGPASWGARLPIRRPELSVVPE